MSNKKKLITKSYKNKNKALNNHSKIQQKYNLKMIQINKHKLPDKIE